MEPRPRNQGLIALTPWSPLHTHAFVTSTDPTLALPSGFGPRPLHGCPVCPCPPGTLEPHEAAYFPHPPILTCDSSRSPWCPVTSLLHAGPLTYSMGRLDMCTFTLVPWGCILPTITDLAQKRLHHPCPQDVCHIPVSAGSLGSPLALHTPVRAAGELHPLPPAPHLLPLACCPCAHSLSVRLQTPASACSPLPFPLSPSG